jgi:hypothetical protein
MTTVVMREEISLEAAAKHLSCLVLGIPEPAEYDFSEDERFCTDCGSTVERGDGQGYLFHNDACHWREAIRVAESIERSLVGGGPGDAGPAEFCKRP